MSIKKLAMAFLSVLALGAIAAGSASAAATTTAAQLYVGGTTATSAQTQNASAATTFVLESEFGTTPWKMTATGLSCTSCTISNQVPGGGAATVGGATTAVGEGVLKFTGVTVDTPSNCTVEDKHGVAGQITSERLDVHADFMNGGTAVVQFIPTKATEEVKIAIFAQFKLKGESCGFAGGPYPVDGTLFGDAVNATGVAAATQQVKVSPTINTNDSGSTNPLKLGSKEAKLTGTGNLTLASGGSWTIK